jgi:hypothetical protein
MSPPGEAEPRGVNPRRLPETEKGTFYFSSSRPYPKKYNVPFFQP